MTRYDSNKVFKVLGRHQWRCVAKLQQEPLEIIVNHGNQNDLNKHIETLERSIVIANNDYKLKTPEGIVTD